MSRTFYFQLRFLTLFVSHIHTKSCQTEGLFKIYFPNSVWHRITKTWVFAVGIFISDLMLLKRRDLLIPRYRQNLETHEPQPYLPGRIVEVMKLDFLGCSPPVSRGWKAGTGAQRYHAIFYLWCWRRHLRGEYGEFVDYGMLYSVHPAYGERLGVAVW